MPELKIPYARDDKLNVISPDEARRNTAYNCECGSAVFLNRLGGFYFKTGAVDKAMEVLQRSLREKPGQIAVYTQIGEVFLVSGRADSAIYYAQQARNLAPESSSVLAQLGVFYLQAGLQTQARAYLDTALTLDPRNPAAQPIRTSRRRPGNSQ